MIASSMFTLEPSQSDKCIQMWQTKTTYIRVKSIRVKSSTRRVQDQPLDHPGATDDWYRQVHGNQPLTGAGGFPSDLDYKWKELCLAIDI